MSITIDLDSQPRLTAREVENEPPDRMLAPDLDAELAFAHRVPDLRLRGRERMAEVPRALEDGGLDGVAFGFGHGTPFLDSPSPQPFAAHPRGNRGGSLREREQLPPLPAGEGRVRESSPPPPPPSASAHRGSRTRRTHPPGDLDVVVRESRRIARQHA